MSSPYLSSPWISRWSGHSRHSDPTLILDHPLSAHIRPYGNGPSGLAAGPSMTARSGSASAPIGLTTAQGRFATDPR
jgi:hypothetical protein